MNRQEMSLSQLPLTLIVAATTKNGIGKGGGLPWPMLKKEMAYFARVTKRVPLPKGTGSLQSDALKQRVLEGTRRNVVVMGRRTWESIPPNFRPLKDRTNVVITSRDQASFPGISHEVILAPSIESGLATLEQEVRSGRQLPIGRAYVIGGSSIYDAALKLEQTKHILLTRVHKEYDCDTYFPVDLNGENDNATGWQQRTQSELRDFVDEDVPDGPVTEKQEDEEVTYDFCLYERP